MTQRTEALTPERILAFVDGELPEKEHREVAAAIAADPEAQAMAAAMRSSGAAAAPAFDEALEAPWPQRLVALLAPAGAEGQPRAVAFRQPRRLGGAWRLAVAASLAALLLGLAGGYALRGVDGPLRLAGDSQSDPAAARFTAALYQALDRGRAGDSVDYSLPTASASGRVTLLGDVQTRSGMACREFSHAARRGDQSRTDNGIACRSAGGGWEILALPVTP